MPERRVGDDAKAVRDVLDGRQESFGLLVQWHSRVACSVAFAHLGNRADAEDAVQDAFIQAYQGLGSLREPEKFGSWLLSIVRHISINAAKRRARTVSLAGKADPMDDLRCEIEQRERERVVESLLASLEEEEREILTLHYFAGMSTGEIAEALEIPRETVKKRLQRTRAGLATPELVAACAPVQEDEDRFRKRVMAAVLLLPIPLKDSSQSVRRVPPVVAATPASSGLPVLVKIAIVLFAGALLAGATIWFFADRDLPDSAQEYRPLPQAAPPTETSGGPVKDLTTGKGNMPGTSSGKGTYQGK